MFTRRQARPSGTVLLHQQRQQQWQDRRLQEGERRERSQPNRWLHPHPHPQLHPRDCRLVGLNNAILQADGLSMFTHRQVGHSGIARPLPLVLEASPALHNPQLHPRDCRLVGLNNAILQAGGLSMSTQRPARHNGTARPPLVVLEAQSQVVSFLRDGFSRKTL